MNTSPAHLFKSRTLGVLGLIACTLCLPCLAPAQGARGGIVPEVREIDPEEGERRLAAFRQMRMSGDFAFQFELEHLPRRGESFAYQGSMFGTWDDRGTITRIHLESSEPDAEPIQLLVINGPEPAVWALDEAGQPRELKGAEIFDPVLPGLLYSAFDLQMPFLFWDEFSYQGTTRAVGRPAQEFLMLPPAAIGEFRPELGAIRIALDDSFNVLLKAEMLDDDNKRLQSFEIREVKRVNEEEAVVKRIDLIDWGSRDKTRFEVQAAALNLSLPKAAFSPEALGQEMLAVDPLRYQRF